ncbi:transposase [Cesiribacter sp. SM1]|uniref:IS110 family transposase n=1 Tax=Cesiribacter sp. SM1 TaxID=2861196 RepID=UPI00210622A5|nr:transposase [Cesiribacter sp. SM1]
MKFSSFFGIDVSKETIDVAVCLASRPEHFFYQKFANNPSGFKALLVWLNELAITAKDAFFLMEHTGSYTLELCCFLEKQQLAFALVSPLHLQRSIGLQRGKNDKAVPAGIDAKRIAAFAFLHRHKLKASRLPSSQLLELKNLYAFRSRLVKTQTSLKQTLKELKDLAHLVNNKFIIKESEKQLKLIKEQVKLVQAQITAKIKEREEVKKQYDLLCSVPGVGMFTALAMILSTNNFTGFENSRKFASYCGVAPFDRTADAA